MAGLAGWISAPTPRDRGALEGLVEGAPVDAWIEAGNALAAVRGVSGGLSSADDLVATIDGALLERESLRTFLARRGHQPTQDGDAELVLLGWRELGPALLDRLEGSFAIAIWDRRERRLWLARDRLGTRALAWAQQGDGLVFATEPRKLAQLTGATTVLSRVIDVLMQGHVSPPSTLYQGIARLEPGSVLTFDRDGRVRATTLFAPSFIPRAGSDPQALSRRLATVVQSALARHPRAGIVLDGTIASAAIAAAAEDRSVETWSMAFAGELDPSIAHARAMGRTHHPITVTPATAPTMRSLVEQQGGPFASITPLLAAVIAQEARAHHDVLLWGASAEELAGAPTHLREAASGARLAPRLGRALGRGSEMLADVSLSMVRDGLESLARSARSGGSLLDRRILNASAVFTPENLATVMRPEWTSALFDISHWSDSVVRKASAGSPLGRALTHGLRSRLAESTLPAIDRALSAAGLQPSFPFADGRWIELATGLDDVARLGAMQGLLPLGVEIEPGVEEARLARWMRGPLNEAWRAALFSERAAIYRYVDPVKVRALLVAEESWNPARWKQALVLWSLETWLSA